MTKKALLEEKVKELAKKYGVPEEIMEERLKQEGLLEEENDES